MRFPDPAPAKSVAEIAHWCREIHEEIVAIGTEDHERLNRIEEELKRNRRLIEALCRAIGGAAGEALEFERLAEAAGTEEEP